MWSILSVFSKFLRRVAQLSAIALLIGATFPQQVSAQTINFNSPIQLSDNDANQGSPTVIVFNNQLVMYYVNHSNNTIYVDFGLIGYAYSTGISVWSAELTDVGAAVLNGQVLISYTATDQNASFALSTNGLNFGPRVVPPPSSLGLGNQNPDPAFVPALTSNGTTAYVATVGNSDRFVYTSYTTDGSNFNPLIGNGTPVSNAATAISRPSLTMFQGAPWVGYTTNCPLLPPQCYANARVLVIGKAAMQGAYELLAPYWGNNNRSGNYAGIGLLSYNGYLYVFGQDIDSSQYLKYIYTNNPPYSGWSGPYQPGNQMRWTPSLTVNPSNVVFLVYQDDANTNISYRHN